MYEYVARTFANAANQDIAVGQERYMKHHFVFHGLKAPTWLALSKDFFGHFGETYHDVLQDLVEYCFEDDHRELQYFAILALEKSIKKRAESDIELLENCITKKSWWDSVDWLAKLVGMHFQAYPHLIVSVTERWMASGNFWLQRVCIIFQLHYKQNTDTELMFRYILAVAHSNEFFLRKAAGWALRQHSRTNPELVRAFVSTHATKLSTLTQKEALRLVKE